MKIEDGIYCCNEQLFGVEGIDDTLFFECKKCGRCSNIIYSYKK
jgi:hypothetical protein